MSSTSNTAQRTATARIDPVVSIEDARPLLGRSGKPAARQTVLALGLRGELEIRQIAGRFVVTRSSIAAYRARHGLK